MKKRFRTAVVVVVALMGFCSAWADIFGVGPNQFEIDFVNIGNAGNDWDVFVPNTTPDHPYETAGHGFGQVNYDYRIGQFEVTSDQFAKARAADSSIGDGDEGSIGQNTPATRVSFHEAARFVNWLTSGSASSGAYSLNGSGNVIGINRAGAISTYGTVYVLPNEDEWYKAAYYDASGANGYSIYANGTSTLPVSGTEANYNGANSSPWVVGTGAIEQNGTYDMNGNVYEWNESAANGADNTTDNRIVRGGYYFSTPSRLHADNRLQTSIPATENNGYGFRVAAIPEPGTISLMSISTVGLFLTRTIRRRKRIGAAVLPVRREPLCDVFDSTQITLQAPAPDALIENQVWHSIKHLAMLVSRPVADVYKRVDKAFWNRMVVTHEHRVEKRKQFRSALKSKALGGFDAFLEMIMK